MSISVNPPLGLEYLSQKEDIFRAMRAANSLQALRSMRSARFACRRTPGASSPSSSLMFSTKTRVMGG